jgi:type I restriction enzyme R subunit
VLTRPRDLTRKQLRELALELDRAGFSEATPGHRLARDDQPGHRRAHRRLHPAGGHRRPLAALRSSGSTALQKLLASRRWTTPQRQWLQKHRAQTKANLVVDRAALDDPDLIFRREGGGFNRLDRLFDGQLARSSTLQRYTMAACCLRRTTRTA